MKKIRGFTLVELMVVLTVIALLLSVVVPDYVGRMKRAEEAVLQENLTRDARRARQALRRRRQVSGHARGAGLQALPALDPRGSVHAGAATWVAVPPADPKKGGVFDMHSGAKGYERW